MRLRGGAEDESGRSVRVFGVTVRAGRVDRNGGGVQRGARSGLQVGVCVRVFPALVCQCGLDLSLCAVSLLHSQMPGAGSDERKSRKQ
jgi:hypothetical protein